MANPRWRCGRSRHWLLTPIQLSGISLNIVGLAGLVLQMERLYPALSGFARALRWPLVGQSVVLQLLFVLRVCVSWRQAGGGDRVCFVLRELHSVRATSAYGAFLIAVQLGGMHLYVASGSTSIAAQLLVHTGSALQFAVGGYFFYLVYRRGLWPDAFWFPPTVSFATPAIVGATIDAPLALQYATLASGVVVAVACWPPCAWRVLTPRAGGRLSDGPAVFVMMAPVPFVTMAAFAVLQGEDVQTYADAAGWLRVCMPYLFVLNVANVLLTALAALQRRAALRAALRPFSPAWASLTFPLVSNTTVATLVAHFYSHHSAPPFWAHASALWASALLPLTLGLIPLTDVLWVAHLPGWWCCHPPPHAPSVRLDEETTNLIGAAVVVPVANEPVVVDEQPCDVECDRP
jgi:hypothetical protein